MKKTLSLILAVVMLLGCMSITAFADGFDLQVGGVSVTAADEGELDKTKFPAITAGTVTYTAAEHNNGTAKLTLNNATITHSGNCDILAVNGALVIELIGENTVEETGGANAIGVYDDTATFTGSGSLTISSANSAAIYAKALCFSMGGTLTATCSNWCSICSDTDISIADGAGKIIAHGANGYAAIGLYNGQLTGYKTFVGSTDSAEEDEANMSPVTFAYDAGQEMTISKVGDSAALSVVLTSNPATATPGKTEITAEITAADFGYTMVIPTATTLTEANHENVLLGADGKVSIKDIKHSTDKVNVSYTVDLTNGDLTDGTNTIGATYKYQQGANEFAAINGTTKVTVYANKTVNDSFVNVTANADQWDAAPAGTYNATVTFNFEKKEVPTYLPASEVDGYYLVGKLNGTDYWSVDRLTTQMLFTANEFVAGEYTLDWDFVKGDAIKVVKVENGVITQWYKTGIDTEYNINEDKAGAGTVFFRPEGNEEWSYSYLTVLKK